MKIQVNGVKAKIISPSLDEIRIVTQALTFPVPKMLIRYKKVGKGVKRSINWEHESKVFIQDEVFPSPFIPLIQNFDFEVVDVTKNVQPEKPLKLPFELLEIQSKVVDQALQNRAALIKGPTSIGKTYIAAALMAHFPKSRIVFLVHNKGIALQNYQRISEWFPKESTGRVFSGYNEVNARIIFATYQSLKNRNIPVDVAIIDECVHILAPTYLRALLQSTPSRWYGLTATPEGRSDKLDNLVRQLFDSNFLEVASVATGQEEGLICPVEFYIVKYENRGYERLIPEWRARDSNWIYQKLVAVDENRNRLIQSISEITSESQGNITLILVHRMNHLSALQSLIPQAKLISYKSKTKERNEIRQMKEGIIIGTRVIEEGVDNHHIYSIINAACVRSRIAIIQRLGRGLRNEKDKKLVFFDIWDQYPSMLQSQGRDRIKLYEELGKVNIITI